MFLLYFYFFRGIINNNASAFWHFLEEIEHFNSYCITKFKKVHINTHQKTPTLVESTKKERELTRFELVFCLCFREKWVWHALIYTSLTFTFLNQFLLKYICNVCKCSIWSLEYTFASVREVWIDWCEPWETVTKDYTYIIDNMYILPKTSRLKLYIF